MNDRDESSRLQTWNSASVQPSRLQTPARPRAAGAGLALASVALGLLPLTASAQSRSELISTTLPYPAYQPIGDDHYSTRLGRLRIRYDVSFDATYTDNRNYQSGDGKEDFGLRPMLNFGLFYPIDDFQTLQLDFGVGYEWWSNADSSDAYVLSIAPNSHLYYRLRTGRVEFRFANDTGTSTQASNRPEFAGGASPEDFEFRQFQNTTSVEATLSATPRLRITSGYAFDLLRSLNDQFVSLDRDSHAFNALAMFRVTTPIEAGLVGSYTIYTFPEEIQNDGQSFSVGPRVDWRISSTIKVSLFGGYTWATFDDNGTITDTSDFSAPTFGASVEHRINSRMSHDASFGRAFDTGFGSNYTDSLYVRYGIRADFGRRLHSTLNFSWEQANQSGAFGDTGDLYGVSCGLGYDVLTHLTTGLYYNYFQRVGETEDRSYTENRVTLRASYRF